MNINGKFFVRPTSGEEDFKLLFRRLAAVGAGRPVDENGFPSGPWTAELLAQTISEIEANPNGVELRTVQLWFQDNDKGISTDNIRWLARVFGCGDPTHTIEWQRELIAAQARLTVQRRRKRSSAVNDDVDQANLVLDENPYSRVPEEAIAMPDKSTRTKQGFSLAVFSEIVLSGGSPLNLPSMVFAGSAALGFWSFLTGIHSVEHIREEGLAKQVGFIWAPNWTILFMVLMPLFFIFLWEFLSFWKTESRPKLLRSSGRRDDPEGWCHRVRMTSSAFWAVFLICIAFAGLFQWVGVRAYPLLSGQLDYAMDWGSLPLISPDIISVPEAMAFTGFAYLYMSVCFFLFFAGLIIIVTAIEDFHNLSVPSKWKANQSGAFELTNAGNKLARAVYRCCSLGFLIAITMKLQSVYLVSESETILAWLADDLTHSLTQSNQIGEDPTYRMPNQFSSLLVVISSSVVFFYAFSRLGSDQLAVPGLKRMVMALTVIGVGYFSIGAYSGFSLVLGLALVVAVFGLFEPSFVDARER